MKPYERRKKAGTSEPLNLIRITALAPITLQRDHNSARRTPLMPFEQIMVPVATAARLVLSGRADACLWPQSREARLLRLAIAQRGLTQGARDDG